MNIKELAHEIQMMKPGHWYTLDRDTLNYVAPAMHLKGPLGPIWKPVERIMESIIGSAYEFRFWEDLSTGRTTFERLKQPLRDGRRTYVSPDRVELFTRTPDGFYMSNVEVGNDPAKNCAVATGSLARARVERRFGELVVKHALGTATPEEEAKLERYQRLRRELDGTAYSTPEQARREWADNKMLKTLKRLTRKGPERQAHRLRAGSAASKPGN